MFIFIILIFQVSSAPSCATELVKAAVCGKVKVSYIEKSYYSPACTLTCKEICAGRHRKRAPECKPGHEVSIVVSYQMKVGQGTCEKGKLPAQFLYCPTADTQAVLPFTTFQVK